MKMVREIQDAKRTIVSAQEEIAAARSKKILGGCFGNEYIHQWMYSILI